MTEILKNKESGLNIICAHLLLSKGILTQYGYDILMGIEDISLNEAVISHIVDIAHENDQLTNGLHFYLIKKCLLIEAERFINENNVDDDVVYKTIKDISKIAELKNAANTFGLDTRKGVINFSKIIQDAILTHLDRIRNYKNTILNHKIKISTMFTGIFDINGDGHEQHEHKKNEIIQCLGLEKNEVAKNTKVIILKLSENTIIDDVYRERRKQKEKNFQKLIKIFYNSLVYEKMDQVIEKAHNIGNIDLLEKEKRTDIEDQLINEGMQIIESSFDNQFLIKGNPRLEKNLIESKIFFVMNIDEESVFEFKIKKEESFKKNISLIIKNKTIERGKSKLPKAYKNLFNSIFEEDTMKKENNEKHLENIKAVLEKQELKNHLNKEFGEELHNDLVKVLEMYEKK
ncbi:uncharacterized protein VNE69_04198 [Vairimorpha necatrix]|uniref:Uncharacterized protein n=1 Tax=Vairimorpha necatrix TaxID=6039 RepID=A0AAX4JBY3_9MICR